MTDERALVDLLHAALDREDVAAPFQRLQLQLETTTGAVSRRRTRRIFMTRQRIALLAAALVMLVLVSVLVGTRLYGHLAANYQAPAHGSSYQADVDQLLARPLTLLHLASSANCPDGPYTYGLLGAGPLFGVGGTSTDSSWGTYWSIGLAVPLAIQGPLVIRGQDLVKGWPLVFLSTQDHAGPVYSSDVFEGKAVTQYTALALDPSHSPSTRINVNGTRLVLWNWFHGFPHGWSGCAGFQIDAPGFTEKFYSSNFGAGG